MKHWFDTEIAKRCGVKEAVVLEHLAFWLRKNIANERNFHDGEYWSYCTIVAFVKLFPYFSVSQMKRLLSKMERDGLIKTGNYNTIQYDRTKWYTIKDEWVLKRLELHSTKSENGRNDSVQPIPDVQQDVEQSKPAQQKCCAGEQATSEEVPKEQDLPGLQEPTEPAEADTARCIKQIYPVMRDLFSIYRAEVCDQYLDKPEDYYAAFDTNAFVTDTSNCADAVDPKKVEAIITMLVRTPKGGWPRLDEVRDKIYNGKTLARYWGELVQCYHINELDKSWDIPLEWKKLMGRHAYR